MKFKSDIEAQAAIRDASNSPGTANQILSSTVSGTAWIDPGAIGGGYLPLSAGSGFPLTGDLYGTNAFFTGNVGIGTTAPDVKFQVQGGAVKATTSDYASPSTGGAISMFQDSNDYGTIWAVSDYNGGWADVAIAPLGGNVGIGTNVPAYKLDVTGDARFGDGNNFNPLIQYAGSGRVAASPGYSFVGDLDTGMFNPNLGNTLAFATGASERMRIASDGNVGIGTTSPGRKLTVQGADDGTMQLRLMGTASQTSYWDIGREALSTGQFRFIASRNGTVITPMVIDDQTGNVGIGTTAPSEKLHVSGNLRVTGAFVDSSASVGSAGTVLSSTNTGTAWVGASGLPGGPYLPLAGGTMTGDIILGDGIKASFGTGSDLNIYHNGTNGIIQNLTGGLYLLGSGSEQLASFISNGAASLFYDNVAKLETTSTGVAVTGSIDLLSDGGVLLNGGLALFPYLNDTYIRPYAASGDIKFQNYSGNILLTLSTAGPATFTGTVTAPTFSGDLNGTINTGTTAVTKANATNDTTVATTAFVQNLIGTIPAGLVFQGTWDAATNTPTLTSGTGTTGNFYIVSTSGSTDLDGVTDWVTGDWAVFIEQGATDAWEKIDNSSVLDGTGTGQTVALWSGSGTSNTLTDAPITVSGSDTTFAGNVNAKLSNIAGLQNMFNIENATNTGVLASFGLNLSNDQLILGSNYAASFLLKTGGTTAVTIDTSQNSTFAGDVTISNSSTHAYLNVDAANSGASESGVLFKVGGTTKWETYTAANDGNYSIWSAGQGIKLSIAPTGAATFAGSLTTSDDITIDNSSPELYFKTGATHYSWMVAAQENVNQNFEITPSTAVGGTTFSTPALKINGSDSAATFAGIVGVGSTGIYAGTNAALNLPGKGIALKNDKDGSNNNWSYINNTATSGSSNINFATGQASSALTLAHNGNATFTGTVTAPTFLGDLNGTINTATTGVTQAAGDNSTLIATTAYADAAVAAAPANNWTVSGNSIYSNNAGTVSIGSQNATTDRRFQVTGSNTNLTAAQQFGIVNNPTYPVGVTSNVYNFYGAPSLTIGTTLTNLYNIYLSPNGIAGSTVASSFGLYQAGSNDKNYFAGNVGIGTTSPAGKLAIKSPGDVDTYGDAFVLERAGTTAKLIRMYEDAADGFLEVRTGANDIVTKLSGYSGTPSYFLSNVGIGTDSPGYKLDVSGGGIKLDGKSALTANAYFVGSPSFGFRWNSSDDAYNNVVMYDNGNMFVRGDVGIGTTSPSSKLEVVGTLTVGNIGTSRFTDTSAFPLQLNRGLDVDIYGANGVLLGMGTIKSGTYKDGARIAGGLESNTGTDGNFSVQTRGGDSFTTALHINSSQNVGIGTTDPVSRLHVVGEGDTVTLQKSNNVPALAFLGSSTNKSIIEGGDNFNFYTGGSSRIYITNAGNVGIGTTSPGYKLSVAGTSHSYNIHPASSGVDLYSTGNIAPHYQTNVDWYTGAPGSGTHRMRLDSSGNLGIGTTAPQSKLQVDGGIQMAGDTATASATKVGTMRYRTGTEYVEVTGTELVMNGDFATGVAWGIQNGTTISGGIANVIAKGNLASTSANWVLYQSGVLAPSKFYKVVFDARQTTGTGSFLSGNGYANIFNQAITTSWAQYEYILPTSASTTYGKNFIIFGGVTLNDVFEVDNVSVIEVTAEDASYADMCMQTGASTYEWVNIVRNTY